MKKRVDVCLITDRSVSLKDKGDKINQAVGNTVAEIKKNPYLSGCEVYFTLVSFANDWTKDFDFVPINSVPSSALELEYKGTTNPAPALEYTIEKAYNRYYDWKNDGLEVFHPLIIFFTDGKPYPVEKYMPAYEKVAKRIKELEANNKLVIVGAGYGNADIDNLKLLTNHPERIIKMEGNDVDKLSRFFSEIIPATLTSAVTGTLDQIGDLFRAFALS